MWCLDRLTLVELVEHPDPNVVSTGSTTVWCGPVGTSGWCGPVGTRLSARQAGHQAHGNSTALDLPCLA